MVSSGKNAVNMYDGVATARGRRVPEGVRAAHKSRREDQKPKTARGWSNAGKRASEQGRVHVGACNDGEGQVLRGTGRGVR